MAGKIFLDHEGAESCMKDVDTQIQALSEAGNAINQIMMNLRDYWQGSSADMAQSEYESNYQLMLTQQLPEFVTEFNEFMRTRVQALIDADS